MAVAISMTSYPPAPIYNVFCFKDPGSCDSCPTARYSRFEKWNLINCILMLPILLAAKLISILYRSRYAL